MTAPRHLGCEQWIPGKSQNPVISLPSYDARHRATEEQLPSRKHKCYFERKNRFVNRGYGAEKKLSARVDMGSGAPGIIQRAGFGCVQCERLQDRWELQYKGYSRAAARGHPRHIDERRHRSPAAFVETEVATPQPTRAR